VECDAVSESETKLRDDLLEGATEIGAFLGWDERKIYHAASRGYLPIKKVGAILIARKSELTRALSAESAA
jgi:hypothetical protein